jgi:hypothetical protein
MDKGGRPSDFKPEFVEQARRLCSLGATDHELAEFFGVDTRTIYRWKNIHRRFCQAVKVGKEKADERVERALFNRAVGYTYKSQKVFQYQGQIVRADIENHVPPDPGAAFNWLKNRRPDRWRDTLAPNNPQELNYSFTLRIGKAAERIEKVKATTIDNEPRSQNGSLVRLATDSSA